MNAKVISLNAAREARIRARRQAMASVPRSLELDAATDPADDVKLVVRLLRSVSDGSEELTRLSGLSFIDGREPDFLAVRTGHAVPSTLANGHTRTGWTDSEGNTVSWFSAGEQPHAYHGVTAIFGAEATPEQTSRIRREALDGLARHVASAPVLTSVSDTDSESDSDAIA